jgi:hypothetical protein
VGKSDGSTLSWCGKNDVMTVDRQAGCGFDDATGIYNCR